jgi:hypothetical protein
MVRFRIQLLVVVNSIMPRARHVKKQMGDRKASDIKAGKVGPIYEGKCRAAHSEWKR